jgi:thymidine kinase
MAFHIAQQRYNSEIFNEEGYIESYCGPMKSGKTKRLLDRLESIERAGVRTMLFKCAVDTRVPQDQVMSLAYGNVPCVALPPLEPERIFEYLEKHKDVRAIGVDEFSFFGYDAREGEFLQKPNYPEFDFTRLMRTLKEELHMHIILSGLNQDFKGVPLGCAGEIMAIADKSRTFSGNCMFKYEDGTCGRAGTRTQRLKRLDDWFRGDSSTLPFVMDGDVKYIPAPYSDPVVLIEDPKDSNNKYEQRCNVHHFVLDAKRYFDKEVAALNASR